jgi:hypothetical protein
MQFSRGKFMHIDIKWIDINKSMLCCTFPHLWTWDDMDDFFLSSYTLLEAHPRPVPVLVNFQNDTQIPRDAIVRMRSYILYQHRNANPIIFVGISSSLKSVLEFIFMTIPALRRRILVANNLTEALILAQAATFRANVPA